MDFETEFYEIANAPKQWFKQKAEELLCFEDVSEISLSGSSL